MPVPAHAAGVLGGHIKERRQMKSTITKGLLHSIATVFYILVVATIMTNADSLFGQMNGFLGPVVVLSLFTLSALVVGTLVLGKPLMLYLDGKKKEAVSLLLATISWMGLFTAIGLIILAIR